MTNLGAQKLFRFRMAGREQKLTLDEAAKLVKAPHRAVWWDWEKRSRIPSKAYMPALIELVPDLDPGDFYKPCDQAIAEMAACQDMAA